MWSRFKMKDYRNVLLNKLIDSYESSKLYRDENLVAIHIDFKFTKRSLPDYFNEHTFEIKEHINEVCKNLQSERLLTIIWQRFEEGNIIERIRLNLDSVRIVYKQLKRQDRQSKEQAMIHVLSPYVGHESWLHVLATTLIERIKEGRSIKRYFDLDAPLDAKETLETLEAILKQKEEIPKRVFSIQRFNNSKYFEQLESKLTMLMNEFGDYGEDVDVLAEENIMHNPGYVYLKGHGTFRLNGETIDLGLLNGEIGISTELLKHLEVMELSVKKVITIENLASFHAYKQKGELVIYLGGYHNTIRREFLKKVYAFNQVVQFYHWGDIDLGGFHILNHLRLKTGIPFKPLYMDLNTLKQFENYALSIDHAYKNKLKTLLQKSEFSEFHDVIHYMIKKGIRLEQEIVQWT